MNQKMIEQELKHLLDENQRSFTKIQKLLFNLRRLRADFKELSDCVPDEQHKEFCQEVIEDIDQVLKEES